MANMSFYHDNTSKEYEAYTISVDVCKYTIVKAVMSSKYIRSIRARKPACGNMTVLRSRTFDIWDWDDRKEFLRCFMALARYTLERLEAGFFVEEYRSLLAVLRIRPKLI
ncbi:hypothetical protein BJX99DRAFT_221168 [Aspergillus californicus]